MFLANLLLCGVFFAAGTALGFVASRCRPQAVQAVMLVVAGLLVGGFLGYSLVLSQIFSIENRIGRATTLSPGTAAPTQRESNSKTNR